MSGQNIVSLRIGVLAVQGGFFEHRAALMKALKFHEFSSLIEIEVVEVRDPENMENLDGLILPGGESTTMGLFLRSNELDVKIRNWIYSKDRAGVVWGTCAGLILMSNEIEGQKGGGQNKLGGIDVTTSRNFFGRQLNSFEAPLRLKDEELVKAFKTRNAKLQNTDHQTGIHGVFIRAPAVLSVDKPSVKVLATVDIPDRSEPVIVAVAQGNLIATAFHPELTEDPGWHAYFLQRALDSKTLQC